MFADKTIAVVVQAYNEELLIAKVVDSMPDFVDHIVGRSRYRDRQKPASYW